MKSILASLLSLLALGLLTGCETSNPTARIQEKSAVFAALTPRQQEDIKAGAIEVGYTADMVYMALGKPSKVTTKQDETGPVEMWTYNNYYPTDRAAYNIVNTSAVRQYNANRSQIRAAMSPGSDGNQKSISSTSGGVQTDLNLPELASDTLYVLFFEGKVFQMKLESAGQ